MYYSKIYQTSIIDGPGVRVSLYVSGCRNHCKGCHNPQSWCFSFGHEYTKQTEADILTLLKRPYVAGLSIVGGEPMEPENQQVLVGLLRKVHQEFPDQNIWLWTGYEYEDFIKGGKKHTEVTDEILSLIDMAVVGKFDITQRDISDNNRWRGSRNQRVVDMNKTLECGQCIYAENIPNNN